MTDDSPFSHIRHPKKRAFLTAFSALGHYGDAARAAGIHRSLTRTAGWRNDQEYQEALEEARIMAGEHLEDAAHRRAVDGVRSYKFDKEGIPLRHPEECDCGHPRVAHRLVSIGEEGEPPTQTKPCSVTHVHSDEETGEELGLESCDCQDFIGRPYYEDKYSDVLLIFLTKGVLPDRYREIREVRGVLAKLDLNQLPNVMVARIAAGEHPEAVLAWGASEFGMSPGELVRGALAPGKELEGDGDATGEP